MDVSIVVPIHNEKESVESLFKEIEEVMSSQGYEWELLFIDDGSTYRTLEELRNLVSDDVKVINFKRNFSQSAALQAGFDYAKEDLVINIDGDMQNDPHDIPRLLEQLNGYDCVCRRKDRDDPLVGKKLVRPLYFLGVLGVIFMAVGLPFGFYLVFMKYAFVESIPSHLAQLLLAVGLFLFGFLTIRFGFLAEMLTKVYYENKRPYVVDSIIEYSGDFTSREEDNLLLSY